MIDINYSIIQFFSKKVKFIIINIIITKKEILKKILFILYSNINPKMFGMVIVKIWEFLCLNLKKKIIIKMIL